MKKPWVVPLEIFSDVWNRQADLTVFKNIFILDDLYKRLFDHDIMLFLCAGFRTECFHCGPSFTGYDFKTRRK